jgi:hypothetical protein
MLAPLVVRPDKPTAGNDRWSVGSRPRNASPPDDMPKGHVQPRLALAVHRTGVAPPADLSASNAAGQPAQGRQQ